MFDDDGSNSIEMVEFISRDGLADTVVATLDYL